ncbi:MAG: CpsD/CapB family tyrosine-protein kinase [Deltaproteobacteria bacterium]|nr:CpsD/CapB family tyrosine-protein kinase [Deltaproteobacteria bacterium]
MSGEKPTENGSDSNVTAKDLFGSIPKPIDVDPFEGIDMDAINILRRSVEKDEEGVVFDEFNHMGGFDIADISGGTVESEKAPHVEDLISLNGVDTDYISVKKNHPPPKDVNLVDEKAPQTREPSESTLSDDLPLETEQKASSKKPFSKPSVFKDLKKVSTFYRKVNTSAKELVGKAKTLGKKNGGPPSTDPQAVAKSLSAGRLKAGCVYSEVNRIRENIVNELEKTNEKTVVFVTPHDDAGNTFLISLLGFNIAYFTKMKTLLVDLNMRRPQLHIPFGLEREQGFTELVSGSLSWQEAVKDTGFSELKVITAGGWDNELYLKITPDFMENMFQEMRAAYDLILMDSSPVLNKNRNNVDPVFLSFTCDMVVMVVQDKRTSSDQITESVEAITRDGGKIDGIVYNRQF